MNKAVIENNVVVNVIVIDETITEWDGKQLVPLAGSAGIGWTWDGEQFHPPA